MGKQLVLTATQAARVLGVGKSTIYRRVAAETLPCRMVHDQRMIPISALKKDLDPGYYAALKADLEAGRVVTTNPATKQVKPAAKRPCQKPAKKGGKR